MMSQEEKNMSLKQAGFWFDLTSLIQGLQDPQMKIDEEIRGRLHQLKSLVDQALMGLPISESIPSDPSKTLPF